MSRIFAVPVAAVYPHYVAKVERKGRTKAKLAKGKKMDKVLRA